MKIDIIAEGIEEPEELDALVKAGVTFHQGFYLGKPRPALEWKNIMMNGKVCL